MTDTHEVDPSTFENGGNSQAMTSASSSSRLLEQLMKVAFANDKFARGEVDGVRFTIEETDYFYDYGVEDVNFIKQEVEDGLLPGEVILPPTRKATVQYLFSAARLKTLDMPDDFEFNFSISVTRNDQELPAYVKAELEDVSENENTSLHDLDEADDIYEFIHKILIEIDTIDGELEVCDSFSWEDRAGRVLSFRCDCPRHAADDEDIQKARMVPHDSPVSNSIDDALLYWDVPEDLINEIEDADTNSEAAGLETATNVFRAIKKALKNQSNF